MKVAVIPARGGSKRLPRKNIRDFCGVPMLTRAVETAKSTGLFDFVLVSTNDEEIATLARSAGAAVPFVRPAHLANDTVGTVPVIAHATQHLVVQGQRPEFVCCIYPCTPFLRKSDLVSAFELLQRSGEEFVYPVAEYPHPTFRAMRRDTKGKMSFIFPECELMRTQDLAVTYHDLGQFYWGRAAAWLAEKRMHTAGIGMLVPAWRFVDIDTENDWRRAELLFSAVRESEA